MSDRTAFILVGLVVGLIALDAVANGGAADMFMLRKLSDFIEYLSFWR